MVSLRVQSLWTVLTLVDKLEGTNAVMPFSPYVDLAHTMHLL